MLAHAGFGVFGVSGLDRRLRRLCLMRTGAMTGAERSRFAKFYESGRRQRPTPRSTHGKFLHRQEADPQELRAYRRSRADAEPDRGAEELLRSLPADGGRAGAARAASGSRRSSGRYSRSAISPSAPSSSSCATSSKTPKYDVEECQQRGITFAAPLKVTLRLVVWDVDEDTGSRSIRDIKEQDVYMGDMPLDDEERHLHHQRHRARHRLPDAPQPRASFSTTTRARRIPRASTSSPPGSSPIAAPGSISSSTPRTTSMCASTGAASCRRRRCCWRSTMPRPSELRAGRGAEQGAAAGRGHRHVEGGDPRQLLRDDHLPARREGMDDAVRAKHSRAS